MPPFVASVSPPISFFFFLYSGALLVLPLEGGYRGPARGETIGKKKFPLRNLSSDSGIHGARFVPRFWVRLGTVGLDPIFFFHRRTGCRTGLFFIHRRIERWSTD